MSLASRLPGERDAHAWVRKRIGLVRSFALVAGVALLGACSSSGPDVGIRRGPTPNAVVSDFAQPPDSVITAAWETLRADGILARSFQRRAKDTTNVAYLESDWVYVPNVMSSAIFGSLEEPEKWVKLVFWAQPDHGGTVLSMDAFYNPVDLPSEPTNWARLQEVPRPHPAWNYVQRVLQGIDRRLPSPEASDSG